MKHMKRAISVILTVIMLSLFLFVAAGDYTNESEGVSITCEGGILYVEGSGEMPNLEFYSFERNNVHTVIIEDGITSISDSAFTQCYALRSVSISSTVKRIGAYAFSFCESLKSIHIPNSVKTIGEGAFYRCNQLKTVRLPNTLTKIESLVFDGCNALSEITIPSDVTELGAQAFKDCGIKSIRIPDGVTKLGTTVFEASEIRNISLPNGLIEIPSYTFSNCISLSSVCIPASVTKIDDYAFYGCVSLQDVYYQGSRTQWEKMEIGNLHNDYLKNARIHFGIFEPFRLSFDNVAFSGAVYLIVTPKKNADQYVDKKYERIVAWDMETFVGGEAVQPSAPVTISVYVPEGFDENFIEVYQENEDGIVRQVTPLTIENGSISFATSSTGVFVIVDKSSEISDSTTTPTNEKPAEKLNFFQRIIQWFKNLFAKLFGR